MINHLLKECFLAFFHFSVIKIEINNSHEVNINFSKETHKRQPETTRDNMLKRRNSRLDAIKRKHKFHLELPAPGVVRTHRVEDIVSIIPIDNVYNIYLGNLQVRENMPGGVVAIVDASNHDLPLHPVLETFMVNINDDQRAVLIPHLDRATEFIRTHLQNGHVVVHCYAGKSRSVALTAAYLMRYQGMTLEHALAHIKHHRPCIDLNVYFHVQLMEYEKRLATRAAAGAGADAAPVTP